MSMWQNKNREESQRNPNEIILQDNNFIPDHMQSDAYHGRMRSHFLKQDKQMHVKLANRKHTKTNHKSLSRSSQISGSATTGKCKSTPLRIQSDG